VIGPCVWLTHMNRTPQSTNSEDKSTYEFNRELEITQYYRVVD